MAWLSWSKSSVRSCRVPCPSAWIVARGISISLQPNISAFADVDEFKEHMDQMLEWLRETKPAPGQERVLYPGLLEYEEERQRRAHGIPLHKEVIQWFGKITGELGLPAL